MAEAGAAAGGPAAGAAGAGAGAAGGTGTAPTGGTATGTTSDWTAGFSEETRGYVQKKGFKDVSALADSYINLEKLHSAGPDRLLKLPESMDAPEAAAVWEKLGKPKDAKGYGLQVPEKGDAKLTEWFGDSALKNNLTANQAQGMMKAWNERQAAVVAQTIENQKIAMAQNTEKLKTEWGAAYEKNMNLAKSGAIALDLDAASIDLLGNTIGTERLFKQLSKIGAGVGESSFVSGRPAADGTVTPEQARSELKNLFQDRAWVQKYTSGDSEAKKRMEHLQKMASPGEMRLT